MNRTTLLCVMVLALLAGCEATPKSNSTSNRADTQASSRKASGSGAGSTVPGSASGGGGPVAYVNGQPIYETTLRQRLYEAAGGNVLSEQVLEALLRDRLQARGITITPAMIEQERQILLQTLSSDEDEAVRLWQTVRARRGLGQKRLDSLLWRNAGLRVLVKDEVQITPAALGMAHQLQYGPKYIARMIVCPTSRAASLARQRIAQGESFSEVAATASIDSSGLAGGLLPPISAADAQYPKVIRDTLAAMQVGEVSDVVALDKNFAVLKLERIRPAEDKPMSIVESQLTAQVRRELERLRMQELANAMLDEARVVVLDPTLNQSWNEARGKGK